MISKVKDTHLHYLLFTILLFIQFYLLLFNKVSYGGADDINHFQIARYAFRYPELFFDLWGKPVYTALLAPFAQMGYLAGKSLNIILASATLIITSLVANHLRKGSSLSILILLAFAPVYFLLMASCLTEILFGFMLISAVYLFIKDRFILAAILISFIPYVRSEGMILLPLFALAFVLKRSYLSIALLATGTVVYSIAGYFVFKDIFWIKNRFPYSMGENVYGKGGIFDFVKKSHFIFGIPMLVLLVPGIIYWTSEVFRDFRNKREKFPVFLLIAGCWTLYFAAHSYVWWKGTGGSLGLERVIGAVLPLAALTCIKGIEWLETSSKSNRVFQIIIWMIVLLQPVFLFSGNKLVQKPGQIDELIVKSANYVKQQQIEGKVFFFNPEIIFHIGIDPYDKTKSNWWVADTSQPSNSMEWGDLLVWDAHFGPNEGGVKVEKLENDPYLENIKSFYPIERVTVLGGYDYSLRIYKKVKNKNQTTETKTEFESILSFEINTDPKVIEQAGSKVWKMDDTQEYSPSIVLHPESIKRVEIIEFELSVEYSGLILQEGDDVSLVFSIEEENKNLRWENKPLESSADGFKSMKMNIRIPADLSENARVLAYVWNTDKKMFYIKSIKLKTTSY